MLAVLIVFGYIFDWYSRTPLWLLIIIGIVVYIAGNVFNIVKINNDLAQINRELIKREKMKNSD
jgi:F0F1-type ATP synthase assembly protein I